MTTLATVVKALQVPKPESERVGVASEMEVLARRTEPVPPGVNVIFGLVPVAAMVKLPTDETVKEL